MFLHELEPGSLVDMGGITYEVATPEYFQVASEGEEVPDGMIPLYIPIPESKLYWVFCDANATVNVEVMEAESGEDDRFSRN